MALHHRCFNYVKVTSWKAILTFVTFVSLFCITGITYHLQNTQYLHFDYSSEDSNSENNFQILFYAHPTYYGHANYLQHCEYKNCDVIHDRTLINQSQAVVFYHNTMEEEPPSKKENQIWILMAFEAPYTIVTKYKKYDIDWVMSYRRDADAFSPYGIIQERDIIADINYTEIFLNKTKDVAWVVSSCHARSKREIYVKKLSKYINVDIFGKCGKLVCDVSRFGCKKTLSKDYKFYLSFENSLCNDYLTEKIFDIYKQGINVIPVVRGAPNARDHLPKNTFILTSDFRSPQKLAHYLHIIGNNESHYSSFLREKNKYMAYSNPNNEMGMCDICRNLNKRYKTDPKRDIEKWLWDRQCQSSADV